MRVQRKVASDGWQDRYMALTLEAGKRRISELLVHVARSHGVAIRREDVEWTRASAEEEEEAFLVVVKRQDDVWTDTWAELQAHHLTELESSEEVWNEVLEILREEIVYALRDA